MQPWSKTLTPSEKEADRRDDCWRPEHPNPQSVCIEAWCLAAIPSRRWQSHSAHDWQRSHRMRSTREFFYLLLSVSTGRLADWAQPSFDRCKKEYGAISYWKNWRKVDQLCNLRARKAFSDSFLKMVTAIATIWDSLWKLGQQKKSGHIMKKKPERMKSRSGQVPVLGFCDTGYDYPEVPCVECSHPVWRPLPVQLLGLCYRDVPVRPFIWPYPFLEMPLVYLKRILPGVSLASAGVYSA